MKSWREAMKDGVIPGAAAAAATYAAAAWRGRRDTGSAMGAINATSHVFWGDAASAVERPTLRHTGLGVLLGTAATVLWAAVFEKVFGRAIERRGAPAALAGGAVAAGTAYVKDYYFFPKRIAPGYEQRVSDRSLFYIYAAMGIGLALGGLLASRRK